MADATVPRRGTDARSVARDDRQRSGRRPRPPGISRRADTDPRMTTLRIAPTFSIGSRRSLRLVERNLYVYKHGWMILLSGFFEPLFYLLGIGFGLGALVGTIP